MPRSTDTIAALATPVGTSALAVIRVSGPDTGAIVERLWGSTPPARELRRGDYLDVAGHILDDVLYVFFRGPHSYTGEDALEISCHGNPFIAQRLVEDLFARGARAPEPGEFTERAFLNGRMDLSQAEAVMDLIQARGDRALETANRQLRGALSRKMTELVGLLTGVVAEVEAHIDFPDEDLPPQDFARIEREIDHIIRECSELKATGHYGELLRNGVKTVIAGAPNVGKSSLLNRLVGHERALVSPEPGTTRDYIEESVLVGPYWLRLTDTAGLNDAPGTLERLGISKAMERIADADLIIMVMDATAPIEGVPASLASLREGENTILVGNKIDRMSERSTLPSGAIGVSALTGAGLDPLRQLIVRKLDALFGTSDDAAVAINARHSQALESALISLADAVSKIREGSSLELVASDLRGAITAFEEIGGRVDGERVLDELFKRFCIGK